jgi:hypothetical protein
MAAMEFDNGDYATRNPGEDATAFEESLDLCSFRRALANPSIKSRKKRSFEEIYGSEDTSTTIPHSDTHAKLKESDLAITSTKDVIDPDPIRLRAENDQEPLATCPSPMSP